MIRFSICFAVGIVLTLELSPLCRAAVTTNWNTVNSGNFDVAANWDNGVPMLADTAVFREGTGATYVVTFPGTQPPALPLHYVIDKLRVGNNTVTFERSQAGADLRVANATTAEAGRGIIIGELGGVVLDTAVLTSTMPVTATAATLGDAVGTSGTLIINTNFFNIDGSSQADDELIIGNRGAGTIAVSGGAWLNLSGQFGNTKLGKYSNSSGTASVNGTNSLWSNGANLVVGDAGTGMLSVMAGGILISSADVSSAGGTLGAQVGASGTALITGTGSTWTTGTSNMVVGGAGTGTLSVLAGGNVFNGGGYVGNQTNSHGNATVSGAGSTWNNSSSLVIGSDGDGTLSVAAGGHVTSNFGFVADFDNSVGHATVIGAGSSWNVANFFSVGHFGNGTLSVENGGLVACARGFIGTNSPTASGSATVTGAGSTWTSSQVLVVGFEGTAMLSILAGGTVSTADAWIAGAAGSTGTVTVAGADSRWNISGRLALTDAFDPDELPAGGTGTLHIQAGGTVAVGGETALFPGATVSLEGGTLDTNSVSFHSGGAFSFASGTLHVVTFNGSLVNQGGKLAPGHSAGNTTITGTYTQQAAGQLEIEVGGTTAGSGHDFVSVTGTATLGGQLNLSLINGFSPTAANTFTVLSATSLLGSFSNVANGARLTTTNAMGSFLVHYGPSSTLNPNQVVLTNYLLPGDYNGDGTVNAADYTVWRNSLGQSGNSLAADGNGDRTITRLDFDVWKLHYGQMVASSANSVNVAVPEPSSLCSLLTLTLVLMSKSLRSSRT